MLNIWPVPASSEAKKDNTQLDQPVATFNLHQAAVKVSLHPKLFHGSRMCLLVIVQNAGKCFA